MSSLVVFAEPVFAYLITMSYRSWFGLGLGLSVLYLRHVSALARQPRDAPCPPFGAVFRIMYGLFGTGLAEIVLGYMLQTKRGEPQDEQVGGTTAVTWGEPRLRVKIVPILGAAFGGNYSFLIWDEEDPQRRAVVVDPADPHPVLEAAKREQLDVQVLLTTHWHFDHSGGNRVFARNIPGLRVVGAAAERTRAPAVNKLVHDLEELQLGRLNIRCHNVPGHTKGSMVYEVSNTEAPEVAPALFTGDAIFCGGCGALFECSAMVMHAAFQVLLSRLRKDAFLFPGHEYTEMLLQMACRREQYNEKAREKLLRARQLRAQQKPTIPSTLEEELSYNPYLRASPHELLLLTQCQPCVE